MYKLLLMLLILTSSISAMAAESKSLGDLLQEAAQAERQGNQSAALRAYSSALALHPEDPQLNIKVAEFLCATKQGNIALHLVKALDGLQKDPKCPLDLKIMVCGALMGRKPREWRGGSSGDRIDPMPYLSLSAAEQKRISAAFPTSYFYPSQGDEVRFRLASGDKERALKLINDVVASGDWWVLFSEDFIHVIPPETRKTLAKNWLAQGKKNGNVYLTFGGLNLYAHIPDAKSFKSAFPEAFEAISGHQELLNPLAELCKSLSLFSEEKKVRALIVAPSRSAESKDLDIIESLIKAGDKAKVRAKIRQFIADYPDSYEEVLDIDNVANIVDQGWGDLIVEFVQPDMLESIESRDYQTTRIILYSSLYNQPRFDYWVKNIVKLYNSDDSFCKSFANWLGSSAPENRIWFQEQFLRLFPGNDSVHSALAAAYIDAGYANRALPILQQLINKEMSPDTKGACVSLLIKAGDKLGKIPEVANDLWEQREKLPATVALTVAKHYVNAKNPEEAQKWLDDLYKRVPPEGKRPTNPNISSNPVWTADTYALRLQVLLKLNRQDDAKALLKEAQARWPDNRYADDSALKTIVEVDLTAEIRRQSESLKRMDSPTNTKVPFEQILKLADALIKTGKSADAPSIAASLFPIHTQWQNGLPLAVAMLKDGVKGIVPFVDWVYSTVPKNNYQSSQPNGLDEVQRSIGYSNRTLNSYFMLAAALLAPATGYQPYITPDVFRNFSADDDVATYVSALKNKKLNRRVLGMLTDRSYGGAPPQWASDLIASQSGSAASAIMALSARAGTITEPELGKTVEALSKQEDWADFNASLISSIAVNLAKRDMRVQAERILAMALKHAGEYDRQSLIYTVISISGTAPTGVYAQETTAWRAYAQLSYRDKHIEECLTAATKALKLATIPSDKIKALKILIAVRPDPMGTITSEFDYCTEGSQDSLSEIMGLIFDLVQKDHKLAALAVPLLDKAANIDKNYASNHWATIATINIWAGNTDKAVGLMQANIGAMDGLVNIISFTCHTEMTAEARTAVTQALEKDIQDTSLSYISGACEKARIFYDGNDEGLAAIAGVLQKRIQAADGTIPTGAIDNFLGGIQMLASRSSKAISPWYQMTEAAIKKAAAKPDDAKVVSEWLKQRIEKMKTTGMKDADLLKKLSDLADSLK